MASAMETAAPSKAALWAGYILTALVVLFMAFAASFGLLKPELARQGMEQMGYPSSVGTPLTVVMIACVLIYTIPRTSILGAILLTGYFGGATATHVRVGQPFYAPVAVAILVWLSLFLRDPRLRELIPLRR